LTVKAWPDRICIYFDNQLIARHQRRYGRHEDIDRRQQALLDRRGPRAPWVEPLIFLSAVRQRPVLDPGTEKRVVLRGSCGSPDDTGVIGTLLRADELGLVRGGPPGPAASRVWVRAIEQAGIRAPGRSSDLCLK
jgi:hypothetical protein